MKLFTPLQILGVMLLTVVIGVSGWVINIMNVPSWSVFRSLSNDLKGARSVTLKEYAWDTTLAERKIASSDIERLRRITAKLPRPFYTEGSLCFNPHHDIKIVRADGSEITIAICFLCENVVYKNGDKAYPHPLPGYVEQPLKAFFASVGMKPKTWQEYDVYMPRSESSAE